MVDLRWELRDAAECPDFPRRAGEPFRPFEGAAGGYLSALVVARTGIKALEVNGIPLRDVLTHPNHRLFPAVLAALTDLDG